MSPATVPARTSNFMVLLLSHLLCVSLVFSTESAEDNRILSQAGYHTTTGLLEQYSHFVDDTFLYLQSAGSSNVTSCQTETRLLLSLVERGDEEALKFLKATGKPTCNALEGSKIFIGSYTNCLSTYSWDELHTLTGKYCFVDTSYINGSDTQMDYTHAPWFVMARNDKGPTFGFCVPSHCQQDDIQLAVNQSVSRQSSLAAAHVVICSEKESILHDPLAMTSIAMLSLVFILISYATGFDVYLHFKRKLTEAKSDDCDEVTSPIPRETEKTMSSFFEECLLSFSLKKNFTNLFCFKSISGKKEIKVLHGIRVLSMCQIILFHTWMYYAMDLNLRNNDPFISILETPMFQMILGGVIGSDTFLFLSGLLVTYVNLGPNGTKKKLNVYDYFIHRIVRLSPVLIALVFLGSGFAKYASTDDTVSVPMLGKWCRTDWWVSLTYLQNFINSGNWCFIQTWYVAVDFQFYILALPVLLLFSRNIRCAGFLMGIYLIVNVACHFVLLKNVLPSTYREELVTAEVMENYHEVIYIKPYCRLVPYLVGLCAGYLLLNTQKICMKKVYTVCLWIVSSTNIAITVFCVSAFLPYIPYANGLLHDFGRLIWALSILWVIVACSYGYGGFVKNFLSWKGFVPLSRVTYSAYLIHPLILPSTLLNTAPSPGFSTMPLFYKFFQNVIMTYSSAFVTALLFELPYPALEKAVRSRLKSRS